MDGIAEAGREEEVLEGTDLGSLEEKESIQIQLMYSFKNFNKLPLDDQLYPISCILKQVVGIIMSQVTAVVVLDFCDDIASIQLTLGRTSDLHLFQEHPRVVPINQITFNSIFAFMFLGGIFCWDVPLSRTTRH